ncbi:unnamed protein product, partial [Ixodes pacificus]
PCGLTESWRELRCAKPVLKRVHAVPVRQRRLRGIQRFAAHQPLKTVVVLLEVGVESVGVGRVQAEQRGVWRRGVGLEGPDVLHVRHRAVPVLLAPREGLAERAPQLWSAEHVENVNVVAVTERLQHSRVLAWCYSHVS